MDPDIERLLFPPPPPPPPGEIADALVLLDAAYTVYTIKRKDLLQQIYARTWHYEVATGLFFLCLLALQVTIVYWISNDWLDVRVPAPMVLVLGSIIDLVACLRAFSAFNQCRYRALRDEILDDVTREIIDQPPSSAATDLALLIDTPDFQATADLCHDLHAAPSNGMAWVKRVPHGFVDKAYDKLSASSAFRKWARGKRTYAIASEALKVFLPLQYLPWQELNLHVSKRRD
jgi:hypothetical protein